MNYLVWTMLYFWKKNRVMDYVSVRSCKLNVIIKNWGIDYLVFLESSIMAFLVGRMFIIIDNMYQRDHGKHCIS